MRVSLRVKEKARVRTRGQQQPGIRAFAILSVKVRVANTEMVANLSMTAWRQESRRDASLAGKRGTSGRNARWCRRIRVRSGSRIP